MCSGVNIEIQGQAGSGKTAILHIIGDALRNSGFNVSAVDDGGEKISEFRPTPPFSMDDRPVKIWSVLS